MSSTRTNPVFSLCLDQRRRWQQGDRVLVEAYLDKRPELRNDPDALLDLVYNEVLLREELGPPPRFEEFAARFPDLAERLRLQFDVHQAIEHSTPGAGPSTPGGTAVRKKSPVPAVPGYEILEEIGRGGMGVVYRARQLSLKRLVALKVIRSADRAGTQELARFRTEAEAAARLQHPNIVQVFEIGESQGLPYLALELVEGESLDRVAAATTFSTAEAARLVETLSRAMQHAHERGIVHRDLKPANVLLVAGGGRRVAGEEDSPSSPATRHPPPATPLPKITDFGLAKLLDADASAAMTQTIVGTPNYMAPEQADRKGGTVTPATDVYALGAILYELLTGRPPFHGDSALVVLEQVRSEEPVSPARLRPFLPRDLETICLKCLEKDPGRRYPTATELADDLGRFLAHEPIRARPATTWERARKWVRRRPATAGMLALVIVAAGALAVLDWHHRSGQRAREGRIRGEERLEQLARLREARQRFEDFAARRAEALFVGSYGTILSHDRPPDTLAAIRAAVQKALAAAGWKPESGLSHALDPLWTESEQAEVRAGCYQLLIALAEATAGPEPESSEEGRRASLRQALWFLDQAVGVLRPTRAYYLRRYQYLTELQEETQALQARDRAESARPSTAVDFFLLGDEHFRQADYAGAALDFQKALLLDPADFWSQYFLAVARLKLQRPAEAEAGLSACLARRPEFAWARLFRALAAGEMNAFEEADREFRTVLESEIGPEVRYAAHLSRGLLAGRRGLTEEAVGDLSRALEFDPDRPHARLSLAKLYQATKDWRSSDEQLQAILRRHPSDQVSAAALTELARNRYIARQYAECLQNTDAALRLRPELAGALFLRAQALLELRRASNAVRSLERYRAAGGPADGDFHRVQGRAFLQTTAYLQAADAFTRALETGPDADLWRFRGWAFFFAEAYRAGVRDFDQALRLRPGDADGLAGRGLCRVMLGLVTEAAEDARRALELTPATPEMVHNIACIFALAADRPGPGAGAGASEYRRQAIATLAKALDMVPAEQRARYWKERVKSDQALATLDRTLGFQQLETRILSLPEERN